MASSRLYPGADNRNHGPFEATYRCYSVACLGKPELEFGDKIILPSEAFRTVSLLKLKLPLLFRIRNSQRRDLPLFEQYCGVLEFSAPEGQVYLPYWMMQNLLVQEGGRIELRSMNQPEKGTFCRFQPHAADFLDLAAQLGPRSLMENAMRQYSLLSKGETICVEYGGQRYYLEVLEVKPGEVVSLLGNLDLEVDFALPKSKTAQISPDRPRTGSRISQFMEDDGEAPTPRVNSWMKAGMAQKQSQPSGNGEIAAGKGPEKQTREESRNRAQSRTKDRPLGLPLGGKKGKGRFATKSKVAWAAFKGEGQAVAGGTELGGVGGQQREASGVGGRPGPSENHSFCDKQSPSPGPAPAPVLGELGTDNEEETAGLPCPTCGALIPEINYSLHTLRCQKNDRYHKVPCPHCGESFKKSDLQEHMDQVHTVVTCKLCSESMEKQQLPNHTKLECLNRLEQCQFCELSFPFKNLVDHVDKCGVRTEQCLTCKHYIKLRDCQDHMSSGECARFILEDEEKERKKKEREEAVRKQLENFAVSGVGAHDIDGLEAIDSVEGMLLQARRAQMESALLLKATQEKNNSMLNRNSNKGGNLITPNGVISRETDEMNRKMYQEIEDNAAALAAMAQNMNTGEFAIHGIIGESTTAVDCSKCGQKCEDYEDLQIHMLTTCPMRPSAMAERKLSANEAGSSRASAARPLSKDSVRSLHSNMSSRMSFQKWVCEACTFENDADLDECEVCSCSKPSRRQDAKKTSSQRKSTDNDARNQHSAAPRRTPPQLPLGPDTKKLPGYSPLVSGRKDTSSRRRPLSNDGGAIGVLQSQTSRITGAKWSCEACTFDNDLNSDSCEVCENPRPKTAGSMKSSPPTRDFESDIGVPPVAGSQHRARNPRIRSRKVLEGSSAQPKSWESTRPPGKAPARPKPASINGSSRTRPRATGLSNGPQEKGSEPLGGMAISGAKVAGSGARSGSGQAKSEARRRSSGGDSHLHTSKSTTVATERSKRPTERSRQSSLGQNSKLKKAAPQSRAAIGSSSSGVQRNQPGTRAVTGAPRGQEKGPSSQSKATRIRRSSGGRGLGKNKAQASRSSTAAKNR